jgi:hypothetical protein
MKKFKTGQKVYWRDPAGETSGVYEVYDNKCSDIIFISNGVSEAEVYPDELYPLSQKVIFRKWSVDGSVIALFPEQILEECPEIVVSYDFESGGFDKADYDFVMNTTVQANQKEYKNLLEKLKEEGYDALEIISKPIELYHLLGMMDVIANKLITSIYITDFATHDRKSIVENNAERPFIWQVRDSGTWLYFLNEPDWKKRIVGSIEIYKSSSKENIYYLFDGDEFYPVFEQTVLKMATEETKNE